MLTLRAVLPALVAAGCCVSCPFDARAATDAYPGKPIRLIVPFPPGGGVDGAARIVGQRLADALGQQIVIDNRGGSGGIIAAEIAAKAVPDGYTLFFGGSASHGIAPHLYPKLAYDAERDFAAIVLIGATPYILVVHPAVPATTVEELIALARARPGQLTHGSSGTGSPGHLAGEVFKIMTHVDFLHVAYKSSGQALYDLLAGNLQLAFPTTFAAMPQVKAGKVRVIAVTSIRRSQSLPDTPTIDEAGVRGYEVVGFYGVLAPAGVPKDIVARLNSEITKALRAPDMQERLLRDGAEPVASTADAFRAYIEADVEKWAKVIEKAGIRFEP
jgi:tripartite-type tricarboxylate transporter receptor subunit TctC